MDDKNIHDKNIHACPEGWEIGSTDGSDTGSTEGWEIGSVCKDADGNLWEFDGKTWLPRTS